MEFQKYKRWAVQKSFTTIAPITIKSVSIIVPTRKMLKKKKKKAINGEERDLLHYHYFMN